MDKKVETIVTILIKGVYITIRAGLAHWESESYFRRSLDCRAIG